MSTSLADCIRNSLVVNTCTPYVTDKTGFVSYVFVVGHCGASLACTCRTWHAHDCHQSIAQPPKSTHIAYFSLGHLKHFYFYVTCRECEITGGREVFTGVHCVVQDFFQSEIELRRAKCRESGDWNADMA